MSLGLLNTDFIPLNKSEFQKKAENNIFDICDTYDNNIISTIPLIHQATAERAIKILETGYVGSYSPLKAQNSSSVIDNMKKAFRMKLNYKVLFKKNARIILKVIEGKKTYLGFRKKRCWLGRVLNNQINILDIL